MPEEIVASGSAATPSRHPQVAELLHHVAEEVSKMQRMRSENFSRLRASSDASRNALRKLSNDLSIADLRAERAIKCLYHVVPCTGIFQSNLSEMVGQVERLEDRVCAQTEKISGICERTATLTRKFTELKHKLREQQSVQHQRPAMQNPNNPPYTTSLQMRNTAAALVHPRSTLANERSFMRTTTAAAAAAASASATQTPQKRRRVSQRARKPSALAIRARDSTLHEKDTLRRASIFAAETVDGIEDDELGSKARISNTEDSSCRDPDYEPSSHVAAASNNQNAQEVIIIESSNSSEDREKDTSARKNSKAIATNRRAQRTTPPRRNPVPAVFPRVHVTKPRPPSPSRANKRPFYYPQPYRVPPKRKIPPPTQETIIEEID